MYAFQPLYVNVLSTPLRTRAHGIAGLCVSHLSLRSLGGRHTILQNLFARRGYMGLILDVSA